MNNITYAVSVDVNNPIIPYNVYVASVLDSNVRYLEITLYQNGNVITLSNTATATASLVTDNVLVDDSVECTISNNIISVPLEDLQRHGNLDVQVTVTEGEKVLAIPFPIQVRVTPNIAENAQIVDDSLGSYAEVVQEIAEARGSYDKLKDRLDHTEAVTEAITEAISTKQDKLTAGENITIDGNNVISAEGGGATDYNDLENKPQINGVALSGNKSSDDLGLQEKLTAGTNITIENGVISASGGGSSIEDGMYTKNGLHGKTIAVIGDSISTQLDLNAVEIIIKSQDIGVQLSAYPTIYDVNAGLTIGGHTFTSSEVGTEVSFTPTASDVGKFIGRPLNYNTSVSKTWWQLVGEEFGCTINPVCWSGSSISSHEASSNNYKTSYAWHDAQIRKCATRIPGSMSRIAPDLIIIYRGCNDMTHTPYAKLTSDTFSAYNWQYPETDVISDGYGYKEALSLTIKKLRAVYPDAQIFLATQNVFKRINYSNFPTNNGLYSLPQFNDAVREVADFFGCQTIDFDKDGITFENCYIEGYITDSPTTPTHPSTKGHAIMAKQAIKDLTNKLNLNEVKYLEGSGPTPTPYYTVTNNLTNTTTNNNETQKARGSSYSAILAPATGYGLGTTTVTMGGNNITSTVYENGVISISNVTGNIVITSTAIDDSIWDTYQRVGYIENSASGKEYINTGITLNADTYARESFELEFDCTSFANATTFPRGRVCGLGDGNHARDGITIANTAGSLHLYRGNGENGWNNTGVSGGGKYRVEGFDWYKNDVKVFSNTDMGYSPFNDNSKTFTLFAYNTGSLQISYMPLKIYSFKMWEDGVLIRDMIPCYRKSDNIPGMIDVVNKVFYQNAGTGSFTVGNDE